MRLTFTFTPSNRGASALVDFRGDASRNLLLKQEWGRDASIPHRKAAHSVTRLGRLRARGVNNYPRKVGVRVELRWGWKHSAPVRLPHLPFPLSARI